MCQTSYKEYSAGMRFADYLMAVASIIHMSICLTIVYTVKEAESYIPLIIAYGVSPVTFILPYPPFDGSGFRYRNIFTL